MKARPRDQHKKKIVHTNIHTFYPGEGMEHHTSIVRQNAGVHMWVCTTQAGVQAILSLYTDRQKLKPECASAWKSQSLCDASPPHHRKVFEREAESHCHGRRARVAQNTQGFQYSIVFFPLCWNLTPLLASHGLTRSSPANSELPHTGGTTEERQWDTISGVTNTCA